MRMGLDTAREDNQPLRRDDPRHVRRQRARRTQHGNAALLNADIALPHDLWRDHQTTSDDQIKHCPPRML
jgi:hypothetical protein